MNLQNVPKGEFRIVSRVFQNPLNEYVDDYGDGDEDDQSEEETSHFNYYNNSSSEASESDQQITAHFQAINIEKLKELQKSARQIFKHHKNRDQTFLMTIKGKFKCLSCDRSWTSANSMMQACFYRVDEDIKQRDEFNFRFYMRQFTQRCKRCEETVQPDDIYEEEIDNKVEYIYKKVIDHYVKDRE